MAKAEADTHSEAHQHGPWRDGPYLVVRLSNKSFPDRCILCNAPAEGGTATLSVPRHGRAVGYLLAAVLNVFVFLMLPRARIRPGLCPNHLANERRRGKHLLIFLVATIVALTAVVAIILLDPATEIIEI